MIVKNKNNKIRCIWGRAILKNARKLRLDLIPIWVIKCNSFILKIKKNRYPWDRARFWKIRELGFKFFKFDVNMY